MKKIYKTIEKNLLSGKTKTCADKRAAASDIADMIGDSLVNEMKGDTDDKHPCPCSGGSAGGGESKLVDFIILVDSSGSMRGAWREIETAYKSALDAAKTECGKEVNDYALFVDRKSGSLSDSGSLTSLFQKSHEQHLRDKGYTGPFRTEQSDAPEEEGYPHEEGAEAIIDLIKHHPWRPGACRAIFYVSDEWLDGTNPRGATSTAQSKIRATKRVPEALAVAMANGVTLFAHHLESGDGNANIPASNQLYHDLIDPTGGFVIDGGSVSAEIYEEVLTKAICQSCANMGCPSVEWPALAPCVHVKWGASDCDCIESHDDEVITIEICNCYSNVTFEDVSLAYAVVVDRKGNLPPLLPDGSPSVHLYPNGPICFGDIGPCEDGEETCVSRQFVLLSRGAKSGDYTVKLGGLCFKTSQHHQVEETERYFTICKD